jgi:hypothetical protein
MPENHSLFFQELSPKTVTLLAGLPRGVQPKGLIQQYPRILNRVAELWEMPIRCEKYIDELLFDTRGGSRQGFAPEVAFEISYLKALVSDFIERRKKALNPNYVNVWDQVSRD